MTESPGAKKTRSNLQLRVISGVVLAVAVLALTWLGGFPFRLFAVVMAAAIFHEWLFMRSGQNKVHLLLSRFVLAGALSLLLVGFPPAYVLGGIAIAAVIAAISGTVSGSGLWAYHGILYSAIPCAALSFLRGTDSDGFWTVVFLFAIVWGTDTIAYFTGRAIGGPKLAPSISPGKTWSGAVGGTVGGMLAAVLVALFAWDNVSLLAIIVTALLLSVASQIGDLFESAVKRWHGVKDSGNLIPGHGGVMDRVDGLVAAAVVLFILWVPFLSSPGMNSFQP